MTVVLKHIAILISSYNEQLTQRSQDNLSDVLLRAGIINYPIDVTHDREFDIGGMEFSLPEGFDRFFLEEVASEYLGMSLEFFHYDGEPVILDPPEDKL